MHNGEALRGHPRPELTAHENIALIERLFPGAIDAMADVE